MINGHCECGRIRYEVNGEITDFSHCHCSQCRRLHGAAYATFAAVPRDKFRYITGENEIKVYASSASNDRLFCGECGSNILAAAKEEPETLYLSMSSVEGNPPLPEGYHAYVGSKAPWHEITDDLPQYEEWAPE
jgi:hypothetical protein